MCLRWLRNILSNRSEVDKVIEDKRICPICRDQIRDKQPFVNCPVDNTTYHSECWDFNGKKCATLNCPGHGDLEIQDQNTLGNFFSWRPHFDIHPGVEFRTLAWLLRLGYILSGLIGFGALGFVVSQVVESFLPGDRFSWMIILGSLVGGIWGYREQAKVVPRTFYLVGGILSGFAISVVVDLTLIISGMANYTARFMPVSTCLGGVMGAFWPPAKKNLLRSGIGVLLAYYILFSIQATGLDQLFSDSDFMLMLVVIAWFSILPLLFRTNTRRQIAALFAATPSVLILTQNTHHPGSMWWQIIAVSMVVTFPIAGAVAEHYTLEDDLRLFGLDWNPSWSGFGRLGIAGLLGSGTLALVLGLVMGLGDWAVQAISWIIDLLNSMPRSAELVSPLNIHLPPVAPSWAAILCIYGSIASLGMIARKGFFASIHSMVRSILLALSTGVSVFLMEQLLETVLLKWGIFEPFGLWMLLPGPFMTLLFTALGVIYGLAQARNRVPIYLTWIAVLLWFAQVIVVSGLLAFLGGQLGLGLASLFGETLARSNPDGAFGMSWNVALPVLLAYIGVIIGTGRYVIHWMGNRHGLIVDTYQDFTRSLTSGIRRWVLSIIEMRSGWVMVVIYIMICVVGLLILNNVIDHVF